MDSNQRIERVILDAWANPTHKACYYTGLVPTASPRLNAMKRWDWTPRRWKGVKGPGTILFPLALGCPSVQTSEGKEWIDPILHSPADAEKLAIPGIYEGRSGEILNSLKALLAEDSDSTVVLHDIQSPLQVAELMWDQSFYISLVDAPDAVHCLLKKITAFIIEFCQEYKRLAGKRLNAAAWPGIWSDNTGVQVSDDTMSLLSPGMHLEFSVPYLNKLAAACGPLIYHSCTWRKQYYDNIHAIGPVKSYNWNPGNSDDPAVLIPAFSGKALIAPHLCLNMHKDNDPLSWGKKFADEAEFFEYHLDCMQDNTCMYWYFSNIVENRPVIEKIYDILDRRGYTPASQGLA